MADENIKDQLVTVPKLANLLAKDRSFVSEIGLDEFSSREIVQKLKLVIGFVFAMYNTAKSIFKSDEYPTLDDKFIELIHSRICLMPEIIESKPRPRDYAEQCYYLHRMKMESEEPEKKWEDMALYEQFLEICVCVFLEEMKLDRPDLHLLMPEFERISSRSILACTFKGVFSYINWELDDAVESTQKVILSPKKAPGPDSRLKDYPLLYLYFSCRFSLDKIMRDENLFLELYKNNLVRLKLWDGTVLVRDEEEFYWDGVKHPEKHSFFPSNPDVPDLAGRQEMYRREFALFARVVEAIKLRYGLRNSDKT